MFHWNTQQVAAHLVTIPGVSKVDVNPPGGDVDTDNITLKIDGTDEKLFIAGFEVNENWELEHKSDTDIPFVELTDGLCSSGGLNSDDMRVAQVFIHVRQYFIVNGAEVVDRMKDYF